MPTIKVRVSGKIAENLTPEVRIVCGNEDYQVEFEFDEPWKSANVKTGLFIYNGKLVAQPFDGAVCPMPIIENTTLLAIGVKTSDGELYTTTPAYADCLKSASDLATNKIPAPSKDVYDEIIALINKYIGQGGGFDEEAVKKLIAEETADLQPKTDESLETKSKEVVGAINEVKAVAETAKMVFGETEGTAYEGNKGKANADNIAKLQNEMAIVNVALEQSGLVKKYKQPITQEYNERVTADGLNVLDGSKAVLKKVVGSTVACKNLFTVNSSLLPSGIAFDDVTQTISIAAGNYGHGGSVYKLPNAIPSGKTFSISLFCESGEFTGVISFGGYHMEKENGSWQCYCSLPAGVDLTKQFFTDTTTTTDSLTDMYMFLNAGTSVINEIKLKIVLAETDTPFLEYQPYFTGLKSASFAGIESTNEDGTETSTLAFPKTETPFGTTIDFENKKITDYGVTLVFDGTEKWAYYGYKKFQSLIITSFCPPGNKTVADYVSTDSERAGSGYDSGNMWCGYSSSRQFMWIGILAKLGYLEAGTTPTTEEANEAVAKFKTWLAERYASGNPVTVRYLARDLQSETDFTGSNEYTAYKGGTEKALDNDGAEYGADNTLTQDYILVTEVK